MKNAFRFILALSALAVLHSAWGTESSDEPHDECISEPIFEGRVCTLQANRDAKTGVILIHGLDGSYADWQKTIPALAKNFHVLAFDLPGFGKSDKGSQEYSPTRYARLAQFLANHYFQNKPYHIVGHSMGGAVALRFASQQPQRFQRLVLIDAAGILHPLVVTKFQAGSMLQRKSGVPQTRGFAERFSGRIMEKIEGLPFSPTDIVNTALGRDRVLQGGPSYIAALDLAKEDFSYAVSSVLAPTLILWGDNDLVATLRTGKTLAENMPHARLEIIADSGHEPMLEQPEQVNVLIMKHLLDTDDVVAERFRQKTKSAPLVSNRIGECADESGKEFSGDYRAIEISNCSDVTIRDARVGKLRAVNSKLELIDTDIPGKDVGLQADNSEITMTNGEISGEIAINAVGSRFDLAGVSMIGTQASFKGISSKLTCSLCRVNSPRATGNLHTFKNIGSEEL